MMMKKLIILNTTILAIVTVILVTSALSLINKMVYNETLDSYSRTMDVGYETIADLFVTAQRLSLDLCTNKDFQKSVTTSDFEIAYYENSSNLLAMDNILRDYNGQNSYLTAGFYPVQNNMAYRYHYQAGLWVTADTVYNKKWMQRTVNSTGEFIWSLIDEDGNPVIRLSKLMYDMENMNKSLGVVFVDIKIEPIEYVLYSSILRGKGTVYLIDDNNNIILPYHSREKLPEKLLLSKGTFSDLDGSNLVFAKSFSENRWKIAGIVSKNVMLENASATNLYIIFIGIGLCIISMALTLIIIRGVFKPINMLAHKMASTGSDELPPKMKPPENQGEITTLYNSFNNMLDRIQDLILRTNHAEKREKEAEIMALQAQINPHFLYNTLDSVNWMAMKYGASDIQAMVLSLSRMLRYSLSIKENVIPVCNELEQVKNYIKIMSMRYPESLCVEYDVDEGLMDCFIIRLVLQPLVENAILHGFEDLSDRQVKGNIIIMGQIVDEFMCFEVKNDGCPGDIEKINKLLNLNDEEKSKHYGIRNVHYRLKKQYGTGLNYKQDGKWLIVEFKIPMY